MKLMIRYADKIVGAFIILAFGILVFVIFMLGSNQRWFSRDYSYVTYFNSASGLSQNMAVQYKGFTIGSVKSIRLDDEDRVEVRFVIFDTYINKVVFGSVVEFQGSPIGGGSFLFHPGLSDEPLPEGETIPTAHSKEGRRMIDAGLTDKPDQDDSIGVIINNVNSLLANLNEAFQGTEQTSLGRTMVSIEETIAGLPQIVTDVQEAISGIMPVIQNLPSDVENVISGVMVQINPVLGDLRTLTERIVEPDSSIMALLDSEGEIYSSLVSTLDSVSGTIRNIERTTNFIPAQMPQVVSMLLDVHGMLSLVEDVLYSLTNNPLLRRGVPQRIETRAGGSHVRNVEF
ncbi:MAG: MlaD family protein [Treponema sp.]|nr:MlaD family protein [Treponema sp.]